MLWTIGIGLLTTLRPDTKLANFIGYCVIAGVGAGNTFQTTLLRYVVICLNILPASPLLVFKQQLVGKIWQLRREVRGCLLGSKDLTQTTGRNFIRMLGGTISLALCDTIVRK